MPKKYFFTKADIIDAGFSVVRSRGIEALSMRAIAQEMGTSTMPIYSFVKSKDDLSEPITQKAFELLFAYQTAPRTIDPFLDLGAGYVIFAKREKHLFRYITSEQHVRLHFRYNQQHFAKMTSQLKTYPLLEAVSAMETRMFILQGWTYAHGLACLVNAGYEDLSDQEICERLVYTGERYIQGFLSLGTPATQQN